MHFYVIYDRLKNHDFLGKNICNFFIFHTTELFSQKKFLFIFAQMHPIHAKIHILQNEMKNR